MNIKPISIVLLCSVLFSCATQDSNIDSALSSQADDLFIVDCLLPGQVRKLGQVATYLTARRAVKTSAVECEIRGGEYVAYDRANLSTALNIWSPKAQGGDPEAQNYVGEIYEKGLGVEPDYEMALVWYKKAARQGYSKAQMNLGFLYEKGFGVEQNMAKAMDWYGKSSSLSDLKIPYAATIQSDQQSKHISAELKLLKSALKNSQVEAKTLKNKLVSMQNSLLDNKEKLSSLQTDYSLTQKAVQLEKNATSDQKTLDSLNQVLSQKTQEINDQKLNVENVESQYKNKIKQLTDALAETQKRAEQILAELKKKDDQATQSQVALLQAEVKLAETEKHLLQVNEQSKQRLLELSSIRKITLIDQDSFQQSQEQILEHEKKNKLLVEQIDKDKSLKDEYVLEIENRVNEVEALRESLAAEKQRYEDKIKELQQSVRAEQSSDKPVIEIIDPPFVLTRGVPTVTLRSVVKQREIVGKIGSSVGLMSLFINDKKKSTNEKGLFKTDVALVGEETPIQIVAIDKNGSKSSLDFVLSMKKAINRSAKALDTFVIKPEKNWETLNFGQYHALIIANNDYQKVPKLDTPETDGREIEKVLRSKYGFKTKLLLNGTRYQILSALNQLRAKLSEDDNLLIYYAGHGELDKVNMRGHWLPIDADADNTANWISTVALTDILNSMSTRHVMVVSDSCYSGAMTRSSIARLDTGLSNKQRNDWLKAMIKNRSRTVLTSGGLKPVMDGGGGQHSVFANAFIKALDGNNQLLEGQALYREVSSNIVAVAADYGIEQVPEYAPIRHAGHESGEFFFVPK